MGIDVLPDFALPDQELALSYLDQDIDLSAIDLDIDWSAIGLDLPDV